MNEPRTVCVPPREHDNEASVNVYEVLHVRDYMYGYVRLVKMKNTVKARAPAADRVWL